MSETHKPRDKGKSKHLVNATMIADAYFEMYALCFPHIHCEVLKKEQFMMSASQHYESVTSSLGIDL